MIAAWSDQADTPRFEYLAQCLFLYCDVLWVSNTAVEVNANVNDNDNSFLINENV